MGGGNSSCGLARAFGQAAGHYWVGIFPRVCREIRSLRERANRIANPRLRRTALGAQRSQRGNLEGAAAFAVLAPARHCAAVVRALVAFQAIYDYVDALTEVHELEPASSARLHQALLDALDPCPRASDYYGREWLGHDGSRRPRRDGLQWAGRGADGGYLAMLVGACRAALARLPSYGTVACSAQRAAGRMVTYQALNHTHGNPSRLALARWAASQAPASADLRWWETSAGAASSLAVFALVAGAAAPGLSAHDARITESAYFPWIGALHVLLDSVVDRLEDARIGEHSLVDHYSSQHEAATRLAGIAATAARSASALAGGPLHALILAAMTSFYLSTPQAGADGTDPVKGAVLEAMGPLASPTMFVLRVRRSSARLKRG